MEFETMTELELKEEPADSEDDPLKLEQDVDIGPTELQPVDMYYKLRQIKREPVQMSIKCKDVTYADDIKLRESNYQTDPGVYLHDNDAEESIGITTRNRTYRNVKIVWKLKRKYKETRRASRNKPNAAKRKRSGPVQCAVCNKRFADKGYLPSHLRIHTGDKPFKCSVCNRQFIQKCTLTRHSRIHTNGRPIKCSVCSQLFSDKSRLYTHLKIHTGKKLFHCSVCSKSFTRNGSLSKHLRVHNGDDGGERT